MKYCAQCMRFVVSTALQLLAPLPLSLLANGPSCCTARTVVLDVVAVVVVFVIFTLRPDSLGVVAVVVLVTVRTVALADIAAVVVMCCTGGKTFRYFYCSSELIIHLLLECLLTVSWLVRVPSKRFLCTIYVCMPIPPISHTITPKHEKIAHSACYMARVTRPNCALLVWLCYTCILQLCDLIYSYVIYVSHSNFRIIVLLSVYE